MTEFISHLSKSSKRIIIELTKHKTISNSKLLEKLNIPNRTLRYNLKLLKDKNIVLEVIDPNDLRSKILKINNNLELHSAENYN
ncbi:MAG: winged helix-turn-helix transcriptional regulator [archaeon]